VSFRNIGGKAAHRSLNGGTTHTSNRSQVQQYRTHQVVIGALSPYLPPTRFNMVVQLRIDQTNTFRMLPYYVIRQYTIDNLVISHSEGG
jgi:hypothetical protein